MGEKETIIVDPEATENVYRLLDDLGLQDHKNMILSAIGFFTFCHPSYKLTFLPSHAEEVTFDQISLGQVMHEIFSKSHVPTDSNELGAIVSEIIQAGFNDMEFLELTAAACSSLSHWRYMQQGHYTNKQLEEMAATFQNGAQRVNNIFSIYNGFLELDIMTYEETDENLWHELHQKELWRFVPYHERINMEQARIRDYKTI